MITMPVSEILDRYSILSLKMERLPEEKKKQIESQHKTYGKEYEELTFTFPFLISLFEELLEANGAIWDLEADIRQGNITDFEEIGKRAVRIRDINHKRIEVKNKIAEALDQDSKDIKFDHRSAEQ